MIIVFRKSVVFLLALLQLFAPLVHAHSGDKRLTHGLHIPGLESYAVERDIPIIRSIQIDNHAEGMLVVMDAGIKNPQDGNADSIDSEYTALPVSQLRHSVLTFRDSNFSPHTPAFPVRRCYSSLAARAPPAR